MRPIDDDGHMLVATKPLRLGRRVYAPDKLPCPVQCAGCVILVNDRQDTGRLRMALSDGSAWVYFVREGENDVVSNSVDLTPLVRAAVADALPGLVANPVKVIDHVRQQALPDGNKLAELQQSIRALAAANLEISEHLDKVLADNADLWARVDFLERHALAKAEIAA